jgi:hypothetical protein
MWEDRSKPGRLSKKHVGSPSSPRLGKLDVKVEVIEMQESVSSLPPAAVADSHSHNPSSSASASASSATPSPQRHYPASVDNVV